MSGGVTHLGEGYAASAYRVRTGEGDLVLRVPKPPLDRSTAILRREVRLLRALERFDLGVAIPRGAREVRASDGTRRALLGTLHRYVDGAPLPAGLRGAARERLCAGIGRFLSALHAVPVAVAERAGIASVDLWSDVYRALIAETLPHLRPASRAWLADTAEAFSRSGGTRRAPRVLAHGDISAHHLLVARDGALTGVIDFGNAMVADPALDFAGVLNDLGWRDLERVWVHYDPPPGAALDADVEHRVRFYIAVVPLFRVLYGEAAEGPAERRAGLRQFAARAAAATRRRG